jgi:hypothetical protein
MSTTDIFSREGVTDADPGEKARAAVKVFRSMQPTLSAYARALTGKPNVRVEVSPYSNGMTDGKRIFFRPPLALGDMTPHDRRLCDKRSEDNMQQLCPACAIREQVLIVIYHEIGHIVENTFAPTTDAERTKMVQQALDLVDKKYADAVRRQIAMTPDYVKDSYLGMARLVSPFLPGIVNALDDARVNRGVMKARKGTRAMFEADTYRIFSEGVEQKDDEGNIITKMWYDYPLNMQAAVALYCKASGYSITDWFVREVVEAMEDEQVQSILRDFPTIRGISGVYAMSIPLLMRLRELGFFKSDTDPQSEGDDGETDEQNTDSSGESEGSESGTGDDERSEGEDQSDSDAEERSEGQGSADSKEQSDEGSGSGSEEEGPDDSSEAGDGEGASDDLDSEDSGDSGEVSEQEGSESDGYQSGTGDTDPSGSPKDGEQSEDGGVDDGESDDSSEPSGEGKASGGSSKESGSDADEQRDDAPDGTEDAPGTGSDHDSSEAGSDVQSLDDEEALGEPSDEGKPGTDQSRGTVDGDPESGSDADTDPSETDEVQREGVDERDDSDTGPGPDDDSVEPIDSGADEGLGGIEVIEDSAFDRLPMGTPEEVEGAIHEIGHPEERPETIRESSSTNKDLERAVVQGVYFETPSRNIFGVREHHYGQPIMLDGYNLSSAWDTGSYRSAGYHRRQIGVDGDFSCSEKILGPALLKMRVVFADNKRGKDIRNKKSGKVDSRVLGKRAYHGDERMFKTRFLPGKKDYFVLIGVDISGSTIGLNIALAKKVAMAQAELCNRMGIKFAVYCHSGKEHDPRSGRWQGNDLDIYIIKEPDEPWSENIKQRLQEIGPDSQNLDGHTFEYYRKILDRRPEVNKVMLYYTDGKMPAENHDEELEILTREIRICRQKKYVLVGVGIRTDSPRRHGLDTVRVDSEEDVVKVIQHLEKRLLEI